MASSYQRRITLIIAFALLSTSAICQDILYGMTRFGGQHNKGVPYQIRTTGKDFLSYKDFDGNPSDRPGFWSRLTQLTVPPDLFPVGNSFAGLTEYGNINTFGGDVGSRFRLNAGQANITQSGPMYFGGELGVNPTGGLLSAFGMFYGTMPNGGRNGDGVLFSIQQIFGNGQEIQGSFDGPVTGRSPKGTPIQASNGAIYGMTEFGGSDNAGVIYSFRPGPVGLSKVLDFDGTARGANPTGDLVLASNDRLYGMTSNGGASGNGVIFSVALDGSDFRKLMDFNGTNGAHPAGSLVTFPDGKLYGMTRTGGASNRGVVFSITLQGQYVKIADFNGVNGQSPYGDLLVDSQGTALHGVTYEGGANGVGVLFKVFNGVLTKLFDFHPRTGSNPVGTLAMVRKFPRVKIADLPTVELSKGAFSISVEATGSPVFFMSDDESILEVNGSQLIPKKTGGARVKVFQLGNAEYIGSFREVMVDVIKSKQTLQFPQLADKKYGDAPFPLTANASSGLPVRFFSSDESIATINGNEITIRNAGISYITAIQEGNELFESAELKQTLFINKIDQTITAEPVGKKLCCDHFAITAYTTSGLPLLMQGDITLLEAGISTFLRPIKAGKSEVRVYQPGDGNYNSAELRIPIEVVKGQGTITFDVAGQATFGSAPPNIYLNANGGATTVTSNPSGIAEIEDGRLYILGVGTTTLTVTQAENSSYYAAVPVSRNIVVHPPQNAPTNNIITWPEFSTNRTLADNPFNLIAWASSGLPVTYTSSDPAVISVIGNLVTVHSEGTATITATQPGSTTVPSAPNLMQTITVSRKAQELPVNIGSSIAMDADPVQLFPYSSEGLPITYEVSDPSIATVENYYLTFHQPGTFTITASQPGNEKFLPATKSINTHAFASYRSVSIAALPKLTYGDSPVLIKTHSDTDLPIVVTSSDPNVAEVIDGKLFIRNAGQFTLRAALNSPAFISEITREIDVYKASQHLTIAPVTTKKFGDAPFRLQPSSTSGLPVKAIPLSPIISVSNNVLSIVASGKAEVQLEQSGNNNYFAATSTLEFDVTDAGKHHEITGTSLEGAAGNSGAVFSIATDRGTVDYIKQYPERTAPSPAAGFIKASDGKYYGSFRQGGIGNAGQLVVMTDAFTGATAVHEFTQQMGIPTGNVFEGTEGFLYGAAIGGGEYNRGTLFKIAKDGSDFTIVYSFSDLSGVDSGGPIQATNGLIYGTTAHSGPEGYGTIYSIQSDGSDFRILHRFAPESIGSMSFNSSGELVQGPDGSLYGTRMYGGTNSNGIVYKINSDGTGFTVLKDFKDPVSGIRPAGRVLLASDGRIYGTTFGGGSSNVGTIFSLLPSGAGFTQHFSFDGSNGKNPFSALSEGSDGRLYGTTYMGGGSDNGTIFAVSKNGSAFTKLFDLDIRATHPRFGPLVESSPGVFFGTAEHGGALNSGAVFRITAAGNFDIYCHCRQGEFGPRELTEDPAGAYWYGVTRAAELNQAGSIFRIKKESRAYDKISDIPQGETISTIFYASTGHLWVAGQRDNLNFIRRMNPDGTSIQPVRAYDEPANIQEPPTSFVEFPNGTIFGMSWRGHDGARLFSIKNDGSGYRQLLQLERYYPVHHPLLLASDGNVYLASGQTSIVRVTPDGTITSIYERALADGDDVTDIIEMNGGRLAFTTTTHSSSARSTIFSIEKDGSGYIRIFQPEPGQGTHPVDIKQSVDGWLYVMSSYDGEHDDGVFYRVRPDGTSYEAIRHFKGSDLARPGDFMFNKATQQLTFPPMAERPMNASDFFPDITTSSGAPVMLTSSNPEVASIRDGLITLHKIGSTVIAARLPANANYYDGGSASQTLVITRGNQTISFVQIDEKWATAPDFELNASSSAGLELAFVSSNPAIASVEGSTVSIHAAGSVVITASQPGNDNFYAAIPVTQTLTIAQGKQQTITFSQPTDKTFGVSSFTLVASTTSGLPLTFTSPSENIVLNGYTVEVLSPGHVTIIASQEGGAEYAAAPVVTQSFCINPSTPGITEDITPGEIQLVSSSDTGNQWFLGNESLAGATSSLLKPKQQGSYTVQVTTDGCRSEISAPHLVVITEVEDWASSIDVYPNPVAEKLKVVLGHETYGARIILMNPIGVPIGTFNVNSGGAHEVDMGHLPTGIYLLQIEYNGKVSRYKVLKQ
ncbi:MAG: choice-of-anchor tandem repeat GloVer-containing protein [Chryseolinea sp.]